VPKPRVNLIRFHGVFAPNSSYRARGDAGAVTSLGGDQYVEANAARRYRRRPVENAVLYSVYTLLRVYGRVMKQTYLEREQARAIAFGGVWNEELDVVFADVARYYDRANVYATLGMLDGLRRRFVATVATGPHDRVLDVCAGTNVIGLELLSRVPTLEVHAIDRSVAMQQVGQAAARRRGMRIASTIGDVHRLPFPDDSFDVVTLQWATRHLRVIDVFTEVHRVLKPGGRFHHCDMLRPANRVVEEAYCLYLTACVGLVARAFGSAAAARRCNRYFTDAIRMFYSTDELSQLLAGIGFIEVVGRPVLFGTVAFHGARKA
jgi:demethylmenaquinone methyltransferase / 2-methoxy-6-polyprenyl-1,4-benzoquinol methylase